MFFITLTLSSELWLVPSGQKTSNKHLFVKKCIKSRFFLTEYPPVALGELGRGGHHFLSIIAPNDRLYMKFKTH